MNLPTKITVARMALIPLMLVFFCLQGVCHYTYILVALIFVIASCTDFIDGYIARSRNMVTDLGKFLDPIADKILVVAGLLVIIAVGAYNRYASVIGSVIILAREFMIGVFRQIAATKGTVLAADKLGKFKTIFTMIAIGCLLMAPMKQEANKVLMIFGEIFYWVGAITFAVAVILTVWSGVNYIVKNKAVLQESKATVVEAGESVMENEINMDNANVDNANIDNLLAEMEMLNSPNKYRAESNVVVSDEDVKVAIRLIVKDGDAKITQLQRAIGWGYQRAARCMDRLVELGLISELDKKTKKHTILITKEEVAKKYGENIDE